MSKAEQKALTRAQAEASKLAWDRALSLLEDSSTDLERWVKAGIFKWTTKLAELLEGDLEDVDHLWSIMEQVNLVTNIHKAYEQKIVYIETLIMKLEDEVLNTPAPSTGEEEDEATSRQFQVRQKLTDLEMQKEVFNTWATRYKKLKAMYEKHSNADGTPNMEPGAGRDPTAEPRRARSPARDKPRNDAKGLKHPVLDVKMPAL